MSEEKNGSSKNRSTRKALVYSPCMETIKAWWHAALDQRLKIAAGAFALLGAVMLYAGTGKQVTVLHDGQERTIRTHAMTVAAAVDAAGWAYSPEDRTVPVAETAVRAGMVIEHYPARTVSIHADGETIQIRTAERIPANVLAEADIPLFSADRVTAEGLALHDPAEEVAAGFQRLAVTRASTVLLSVNGEPVTIRSAAVTLGEAVWEAGITLHEGDALFPGPDTLLRAAQDAELVRAQPFEIDVDGGIVTAFTVGETVGEALVEAGVALQGLDYAIPPVEDPLPDDGAIQVVRVMEDVQVELEPIPFSISYQPVGTLEIDQLQIVEEGTYGVEAVRVRIRRENGQEVSRSDEERWTAVEAVPRVVGYGTNIVIRTINTPSGTLEYWRSIPVYATSYSPCNLGVDWCGYTTASGAVAQKGVIGVIRSWYNAMQGQRVYVPNYGIGSIEDIGAGFADRDWIDLGFSDEDFEGWHQWTTLYFLTPVPPLDAILWILP